MKCYNCGIELNNENRTKEHIPAKAFFVGYDEEYKLNRITVPACRGCNEQYSKTDQEIRDAIGIANDDDEKAMELTRKSAKSILRKRRNKLHFDKIGKLRAVEFRYEDLANSAIKDFKGIFLKKYSHPVPQDWKIEIIADFEDQENIARAAAEIFAYLNQDTGWSQSGHEEIFRYKIKSFVPDEHNRIIDTGDLEKALSVASVQEYHQKLAFIIVASKLSTLNSIRRQSSKKSRAKKANQKIRAKNRAAKNSRRKNRKRKK